MSSVSIDWLQIHIKIDVQKFSDAKTSKSGAFKLGKMDIRSNVFNQHREIFSNVSGNWEACAVLSFEPLSQILPVDSAHIKILNKYLYQSDLKRFVHFLLSDFGLRFQSISRLDVCRDFQKFDCGLLPETFCNQFVAKKILKLQTCRFAVEGTINNSVSYHYLRFGTKSSDVQFYIYNKSKELREKTDKPYIRDGWKRNGLNADDLDVWRIEFVCHPSKYGAVEMETGEIVGFNTLEILEDDLLNVLFYALLNRYAVFVRNDGKARKDRMKRIELFKPLLSITPAFVRVSDKTTSNRVDKMLIKKMYQLQQDWRESGEDNEDIGKILSEFIDRRDLNKWFLDQCLAISSKPKFLLDEQI